MRKHQIALFALMLMLGLSAQAGDWRAVLERAGFMGAVAAGFSYEWEPEHAVDLSLGAYPMDDQTYYQTNFVYRYSRWNSPVGEDMWRPLQFGTTYTFMPSRFGLAYRLRIFDNGVIAIFNNSNRDLQYYISSGFSLQYLF